MHEINKFSKRSLNYKKKKNRLTLLYLRRANRLLFIYTSLH